MQESRPFLAKTTRFLAKRWGLTALVRRQGCGKQFMPGFCSGGSLELPSQTPCGTCHPVAVPISGLLVVEGGRQTFPRCDPCPRKLQEI